MEVVRSGLILCLYSFQIFAKTETRITNNHYLHPAATIILMADLISLHSYPFLLLCKYQRYYCILDMRKGFADGLAVNVREREGQGCVPSLREGQGIY